MESRWHRSWEASFLAFEQTHSSGVSREDFSHLLRRKPFPSVYREEKQKRAPDGFCLIFNGNRPNSPPGHGIKIQGEGRDWLCVLCLCFKEQI